MQDNFPNALSTPFSKNITHHRRLTWINRSYTKKSQTMPQKRPLGPTVETILPPSLARTAAPGNSRPRFVSCSVANRSKSTIRFTEFSYPFPDERNSLTLRSQTFLFKHESLGRPSPCLGTHDTGLNLIRKG